MGTLKLNNLKIKRENFQISVPELNVSSGSVLGIVGKSGCGKSTLLNAIAGFEPLISGQITFDNMSLSSLPPEERKIAIVFQRPALFSHMSVIENVCFGLKVQGLSLIKQRELAMYWLAKLQISNLANRPPEALSGGEAQRVALARSVVVGFPILLLDEPFSGLDPQSKISARDAVKQTVEELKPVTILVSHDSDDIEDLADEVCTMDKGRITGGIKKAH